MSRIRILRIIARMNVGGPALQVTNLMRLLPSDRFDQRLLVGDVDEGEADYVALRAPGLPVTRVPGLGRSVRLGGDVRAYRAIAAHIREFRPHIVHTHTSKAGVLGRAAALAGGVPHRVHTFHGHLLHGYFSPAVTAGLRQVERELARRTDCLVAVGSQVRDDLLAVGIGRPEQYLVVPPGIALPPAPPAREARRRLGLPDDALVLSFVARMTNIKRPERALEVLRAVLLEEPRAILLLVGEGPLLNALRGAAADLGDRVRFLGWRPDVEVIHAASDLALLTSDNEGMPVSLIEAAMSGRPAVATDVGSAREVVVHERTGLVVPISVPALAGAVLALARAPELRARYGMAARAHALAQFGAERLAFDMEALYRSLATADQGRRSL